MFSTTPVQRLFPEDTEDNNKRWSQDKCPSDWVLKIQATQLDSRVLSTQQQFLFTYIYYKNQIDGIDKK